MMHFVPSTSPIASMYNTKSPPHGSERVSFSWRSIEFLQGAATQQLLCPAHDTDQDAGRGSIDCSAAKVAERQRQA